MVVTAIRNFFSADECSKYYKIGKKLGSGSFAVVKQCTDRTDKSVWALKILSKKAMQQDDFEALETEVKILGEVGHPGVVKLREVFDTKKKFYMVMEIMTGGELFDRIVAKEKYTELEAKTVIKQIAQTLSHCHRLGIVHRDLKPENLLYETKEDDSLIKVADFGLAKLLSREAMMMHTACGTPGYVAPEILEGGAYGYEVDMWSLGVILYILLCGFPPFYEENNAALFACIKSCSYDFPSPYWDAVSPDAIDLIQHLICKSPKRRFSTEELLAHRWMKDASSTGHRLGSALTELRKFNARRKFKAGVMAAKAMQMLRTSAIGS